MAANEKRMTSQKSMTLKITTLGMLAALAIAMMYMFQIPIIPAAPYMLYDMADIPILIGTLFYGPAAGIILTVIVSVIQGLTVSASGGFIGIIMHIAATGTFVLVTGLLCKKSRERLVLPLILGVLSMAAVMIPLNLILSPIFYQVPVQAVVDMILPIIVPFNLLKAGINGFVTYLVFQALIRILPRLAAKR